MSKLFKQIDEKLVDGEQRWTYELKIIFNYQSIIQVTITDYYQAKHGDAITNELILNILQIKLDKVDPLPESHLWNRNIFRWEISYQGKKYRLIFWFKAGTTNHLWIRNCYPID